MVQWTWQTLGMMILAVVGGALLLTWGLGGFGSVKDAVNDTLSFVGQFIGAEQIQAEVPTISQDYRGTLRELRETLEQMRRVPENVLPPELAARFANGCFANYGQFPPPGTNVPFGAFPPLGEGNRQSVSMEMRFDDGGTSDDHSDDKTEVFVRGGAGGRQDIPEESFVLEGVRPCVVAGSSNGFLPARRFFAFFIDPFSSAYEPYPYLFRLADIFTPVNALYFNWGLGVNTGNIVRWEPSDITVDEDNNLLDGGWLYTPDFYHMCFFPTVDEQDFATEGIDDSFISDASEENSLAWQGRRYQLPFCEEFPYRMQEGAFGPNPNPDDPQIVAFIGRDRFHYRFNRAEDRWEFYLEGLTVGWLPTPRGQEDVFPTPLTYLSEIGGYDYFNEIQRDILPASNNPSHPRYDEWVHAYHRLQALENVPRPRES